MLTTTLIVALFVTLIAIILLIALIAINLGLYLWEWIDDHRKARLLKARPGGDRA